MCGSNPLKSLVEQHANSLSRYHRKESGHCSKRANKRKMKKRESNTVSNMYSTTGWQTVWADRRDFRISKAFDKRYHAKKGKRMFSFCEEDFTHLFGSQIARYCQESRERFHVDRLSRLGLTNSIDDTEKHGQVQHEDWNITHVWISDGSCGEIADCYYALHDGGEKYIIDLYTLGVEGITPMNNASVIMEGIDDEEEDVEYWSAAKSAVETVLEIDRWCTANRQRRLLMTHPGSRRSSPNLKQHYTREIVRFRDHSKECLRASFVQGISILAGHEAGLRIWKEMLDSSIQGHRGRVRGLRDLQKTVLESRWNCVLRNSSMTMNLEGLVNTKEGVYLVVLQGNSRYDGSVLKHCVCVDCKHGLVYDCTEKRAMQCCEEALQLCVGDDHDFSKVDEVRKIELLQGKQHECRSNRKRRAKERLENYKKKRAM